MSSASSWRPNAPESQLFDEKTWLQGGILSAVAYGINLTLFILNVSLLRMRAKLEIKHDIRAKRQTICLLIYVCVIFILSTLTMASQAEMTQLGFIDDRDFPGGPAAYEELKFSSPISSLGNYCVCLMIWFSDSLLLWRCFVIYKSSRTSVWLVMALPGLLLLASFVTGIIYLARVSQPSSSPWSISTLTLVYVTISFGVNVVLTLMIVIRLYFFRRRTSKVLGPRHAVHYTSIIAILVESAALVDITLLFFIIPFAMGNPLANIPLSFGTQVQATSSYMIIFRVAQGIAWTPQTTVSDLTIHGMSGRLKHRSITGIRFQVVTDEHPDTNQLRNQLPLDEVHDVLDAESNSNGIFYENTTTSSAGSTEIVGPNAN